MERIPQGGLFMKRVVRVDAFRGVWDAGGLAPTTWLAKRCLVACSCTPAMARSQPPWRRPSSEILGGRAGLRVEATEFSWPKVGLGVTRPDVLSAAAALPGQWRDPVE